MAFATRLMKQATTNRKIELYTSGGVIVENHLVLADDVVFFCHASHRSIRALREVLDEFTMFLGLKINCEKSCAIFSKRVTDRAKLAVILGFQVSELPVKYLGTPLTDKSIRYKDCDALLAELRTLLTRWSGKKLSYMGRVVQLVDWVFQGKFGYLIRSNIVPRAALETIQSIAYRFIWGAQKKVVWRSMIRTKSQGEMGVRDFRTTQLAAIVERACRMWEGDGIWSSWMSKRYIKERPLQSIEQRQGESMMWKTMLRQKEQIAKCVTLEPQNSKIWIGKGVGNSIKNAANTIVPEHPKDELAKRIWANKIGKVALNLCR